MQKLTVGMANCCCTILLHGISIVDGEKANQATVGDLRQILVFAIHILLALSGIHILIYLQIGSLVWKYKKVSNLSCMKYVEHILYEKFYRFIFIDVITGS